MKTTEARKVVVLSSGGMDSTVCLAMAVHEFGVENTTSLSITYGQKHEKELKAARDVAQYYNVAHYEKDLTSVFDFSDCSLLQHSSKDIDHTSYAEQISSQEDHHPVATYVPFRNGLFLSCAAAIAYSMGADVICYGAHADDAAGSAYPDCSVPFVKAMNKAVYEGTGNKVRVWAPLIRKTKTGVLRLGLQYEAPLQLTWSCYEGGEKPCGVCGTCRDRAKAFADLGIPDPAFNR